MQHKTHALHISNREMKLEEEQVLLVNQYMFEKGIGQDLIAGITLDKAAQVNAEYDRERQRNVAIAEAMINDTARDLLIQQTLS